MTLEWLTSVNPVELIGAIALLLGGITTFVAMIIGRSTAKTSEGEAAADLDEARNLQPNPPTCLFPAALLNRVQTVEQTMGALLTAQRALQTADDNNREAIARLEASVRQVLERTAVIMDRYQR